MSVHTLLCTREPLNYFSSLQIIKRKQKACSLLCNFLLLKRQESVNEATHRGNSAPRTPAAHLRGGSGCIQGPATLLTPAHPPRLAGSQRGSYWPEGVSRATSVCPCLFQPPGGALIILWLDSGREKWKQSYKKQSSGLSVYASLVAEWASATVLLGLSPLCLQRREGEAGKVW